MRFGIYVHHPWCVRKCAYCAFNVYTDPNPPFLDWKRGVLRDWEEEKQWLFDPPYSLYFGGGTPSLAPTEIIAALIDAFGPQPSAEITLEINPGDLNRDHLSKLHKSGVNRYSVGVQSFNPRFARLLNRSHTIADNHHLLHLFAELKPPTWSLDLMFGLPDQSLQELRWDLEQAMKHNPPHISIYGLTIEEGTPLATSVARGVTTIIDDEIWRDQFSYLMEFLEEEGYEQYEISNFARPGHRSKHNEHIWKNGHYVGLGPGAHGFRIDGRRTIQHPQWERWLSEDHLSVESPNAEQALIDMLITQLRHIEGFPLSKISEYGFSLDISALFELQKQGWISLKNNRICLEKKGRFFGDWISHKIIAQIYAIAV